MHFTENRKFSMISQGVNFEASFPHLGAGLFYLRVHRPFKGQKIGYNLVLEAPLNQHANRWYA